MMKRVTLGFVLLALASMAPPSPLGAQEAVLFASDPGWIGISYDVSVRRSLASGSEQEPPVVVLSRVYQGSPAAEAGLQAGDTILTVNGVPASGRAFQQLALEPGDRVSMTFRRDGETRELTLTATERPQEVALYRVSPAERIRMDSVRTAIVRFMEDSARVSLETVPFRVRAGGQVLRGDEGQFRVFVQGDTTRGWTVKADSLTVVRGEVPAFNWFRYESGESSFPFSAFVAHSEQTDSILSEMRELRAQLEEARRAELQRQRELAESLAEEQRRIDRSDEELRKARELQAQLRARLARVQETLERESRRELMARVATADSLRATGIPSGFDVRIPAPHVVGRSVVAGAQLLALNAGLGEYFGTDQGVLVTEVVPGSPAEAADVQSGDVLVAVAGQPVGSVAQVRDHLGDPRRWPVELTLLRKGERLTVELRR